MTEERSVEARVGVASAPKADRVAFVGTGGPLSEQLRAELARQCASVLSMPSRPEDSVDSGSRAARGDAGMAVPLIVMLTWADLLAEGYALPVRLAARADAIARS